MVSRPAGLTFSPNGDALYVTSVDLNGFHQIFKFDGTTGLADSIFATLGPSFPAAGCCPAPSDLAFGPDGLLYVSNTQSIFEQITRFNVDGTPLGVFGQANLVDSGLKNPRSLEFGPDGHLYVTMGGSPFNAFPTILRFDGSTGDTLGIGAIQGDGNAQFIRNPGFFWILLQTLNLVQTDTFM